MLTVCMYVCRLTAVCVEERMMELKSILNTLTDLDRATAPGGGDHGERV